MGKHGHKEEEILRVVRKAEFNDTVVEICRKYEISQQTLYLWKKEYAGLGLNELLGAAARQLREENAACFPSSPHDGCHCRESERSSNLSLELNPSQIYPSIRHKPTVAGETLQWMRA